MQAKEGNGTRTDLGDFQRRPGEAILRRHADERSPTAHIILLEKLLSIPGKTRVFSYMCYLRTSVGVALQERTESRFHASPV